MTDQPEQNRRDLEEFRFLCGKIGRSIAGNLLAVETPPDDLKSAIDRELDAARRHFVDGGACAGDAEIAVDLIYRSIVAEGLSICWGTIVPEGRA